MLNDLAIIVAVKNGENTIADCLVSLRESIEQGAQLFIYDACSTDNTRAIVNNLVSNANYVCEEDGGLYFAWNRSLKETSREFIFFINCDDMLCSTSALLSLVENIRSSDAVACSGLTQMRRQDGVMSTRGRPLRRNWFIGEMPIVTPATVFRVRALREIGGFDSAYRISSDYDLMLRLLRTYGRNKFIHNNICLVNFSIDGMSNRQRSIAFREIDVIVKNRLGTLLYFLHKSLVLLVDLRRVLLSVYFMYLNYLGRVFRF